MLSQLHTQSTDVRIKYEYPTHSVRHILIKTYQYSCNKTTHTRKYLGLDYSQNFTTAYVPMEHRQNMGYIFLSKIYKCIFSTNLHYHIFKKNLYLHNKSILPHSGLATMKADNLRNVNSLALPKLGGLTNSSNCLNLKLWTYHTPLIGYEQESGVKGSF